MNKRGFTLVELLVVVLIIGCLAAIGVPRIAVSAEGAKISSCRNNVQIINSQIERFHLDTGSWPLDLGEVVKNTDYFPDGPPVCPFGAPYQLNEPIHHVFRHKHVLESKSSWVIKYFSDLN